MWSYFGGHVYERRRSTAHIDNNIIFYAGTGIGLRLSNDKGALELSNPPVLRTENCIPDILRLT